MRGLGLGLGAFKFLPKQIFVVTGFVISINRLVLIGTARHADEFAALHIGR